MEQVFYEVEWKSQNTKNSFFSANRGEREEPFFFLMHFYYFSFFCLASL